MRPAAGLKGINDSAYNRTLVQLMNLYHHMRMREKRKIMREKSGRHYLDCKHLNLAQYRVITDAIEWSA